MHQDNSSLKTLEERKARLLISLERARKAQFEADGKMVSRYDTQKEDAAQDVAMYEGLISEIDNLISTLKEVSAVGKQSDLPIVTVGRRIKIRFEDGEEDEFLLLDSQGGVNLGEIQTLSTNSPVGKAILGAEIGERRLVSLATTGFNVEILRVE